MRVDEEVPAALDGERLDRIVSIIADISRSDSSALIEAGGAWVDGVPAPSGKVRLVAGQSVTVDLSMVPVEAPPGPDPSVHIDVVYSDDQIVVINKAVGQVVHPAPGHSGGTIVNGLLAAYPDIATVGESHRPGIVHRLDAGTSGLMVVARTQHAYESLVGDLSRHDVVREYLALAWGRFESVSQVVDAAIGRDPRDPMKMAVVHEGKWARTRVELERQFDEPVDLALVRCSLETGRTHQIRVHLAAIGHPVVGDSTYGGARNALRAARPMLHAAKLELRHPTTGHTMSWEVPMPPDMSSVLEGLSISGHD